MRQLNAAAARNDLNELEREGMIQRFEYCYELAWKTLQDLLTAKGYVDIKGPSPVLKQAFKDGYLDDADGWKLMRESRQLTSHTYDEATAIEIARNIKNKFCGLLDALNNTLAKETD